MEIQRKIEKYLEKSMTEPEKAEFEELLRTDEKLASEYTMHKEVNEAILNDETEEFRKLVSDVVRSGDSAKRRIYQMIISAIKIPLAAAVLILISVSLYKIITRSGPDALYGTYYEPYQSDVSVRSETRNIIGLDLAYSLYEEGDFGASFEILNNYVASSPEDQVAHFYLGLNAMELQLYDRAINEFLITEEDTLSPFALHSKWYLALACLKARRTREAKLYLQLLAADENSLYTDRAKQMLRRIRS